MAQRVNIEVLNKAAVDVTVQNSNAINVEVPTAPRGLSAEFTASRTEIDQFETVDFSATSAGFEYYWEIEDNRGFIFKKGKNVSNEYRDVGEFDVALTQADLNQQVSGIQVKRDFIKVNQAPFLLNQPFGTGATAAYSLRKLKSSATKAVRVREDSSNTEADIGFKSNGELDETALSNHCGSANGFVTKWYDQSGNGNDASNSTASEQPQIVNSGSVIKENGKPALEFDGSDDEFFANFQLITPFSFFSVFTFENFKIDRGLVGNFNALDNVFFRQVGGALQLNIKGSAKVESPINNNQEYLGDSHLNSSKSELFVDNVQEDTGSGKSGTFPDNPFTIGNAGPDSNNFHKGVIKELIIYDEVNKLSERSDIANNINNFYSIT